MGTNELKRVPIGEIEFVSFGVETHVNAPKLHVNALKLHVNALKLHVNASNNWFVFLEIV